MILDETNSNEYLDQVRKGTLKQGLEIGCDLDNHLRYKPGNFNLIIGQANVGKTDWIVWYMVCLSVKHSIDWLVFSSENTVGSLKAKILEYYTSKKIKDLTQEEFNRANQWLNFKFKFIDTNRLYSGYDLLKIFEENKDMFDGAIIDPYNSLTKELLGTNSHEYDYQMASEFRLFCKKFNKSIYIIAHCVTESLRRVHHKDHEYSGHPIPPSAADIEGGGKWVNRADDFIVLHRYTQHETEWMYTHVHVRKVKETETGGKPTFIDKPVVCTKHYQGFLVGQTNPLGEDYKPKPLEFNTEFDDMYDEFNDVFNKDEGDELPF